MKGLPAEEPHCVTSLKTALSVVNVFRVSKTDSDLLALCIPDCTNVLLITDHYTLV
jgi:hypothetical protein